MSTNRFKDMTHDQHVASLTARINRFTYNYPNAVVVPIHPVEVHKSFAPVIDSMKQAGQMYYRFLGTQEIHTV